MASLNDNMKVTARRYGGIATLLNSGVARNHLREKVG